MKTPGQFETKINIQAGIAERQAASRYLKALVSIDVLSEMTVGKEKLFVHPKLMHLLTQDDKASSPDRT
jgi:hypothetical protein